MDIKIYLTGSEGLIGSAFKEHTSYSLQLCDLKLNSDFRTQVIDDDSTHVLHLAAVSRVIDAEINPCLAENLNFESIENFILRCGKHRKIILASSKEVYGDQFGDVYEYDILGPKSLYATTKSKMERLANDYFEKGYDVTIVRFSTVFGGLDDHATRVIPLFVHNAINNKAINVYGGQKKIFPTAVSSVVKAVEKILISTPKSSGKMQIYNLVGSGTTIIQLAKYIVDISKSTSIIQEYADDKNIYASANLKTRYPHLLTDNWKQELCMYVDKIKNHVDKKNDPR